MRQLFLFKTGSQKLYSNSSATDTEDNLSKIKPVLTKY